MSIGGEGPTEPSSHSWWNDFLLQILLQDADRPDAHITVKKIFVSGIKDEIETDDLRDYFSTMGDVVDVDIIIDKDTKRKRGFAFVQFDDYDPVDKAVCKYFLLP